MNFAVGVPLGYYEALADEFDAVAKSLARRSSAEYRLVRRLRGLAREIRESTSWLSAA